MVPQRGREILICLLVCVCVCVCIPDVQVVDIDDRGEALQYYVSVLK
jgi:hypothetical protein